MLNLSYRKNWRTSVIGTVYFRLSLKVVVLSMMDSHSSGQYRNAVKRALNQEGLDITPLTEFEQYKRHVLEQEKYGHDWDVFLNEKPQLRPWWVTEMD